MNRVFKVKMSHPQAYSSVSATLAFEVVAHTAEKAISKARAQAHRESSWRGAWLVEKLVHRGPAV